MRVFFITGYRNLPAKILEARSTIPRSRVCNQLRNHKA